MNRKLFGLVINAIYDGKNLYIYIEIVGVEAYRMISVFMREIN